MESAINIGLCIVMIVLAISTIGMGLIVKITDNMNAKKHQSIKH